MNNSPLEDALPTIQFMNRSELKYLPNDKEILKIASLGDIIPSLLAVMAFLLGGLETACDILSDGPIPFWLLAAIKYILISIFWVYYYFLVKVTPKKKYHAFSRTTRWAATAVTFITLLVVSYNLYSSIRSPSPILPQVIATTKWENWNILDKSDTNYRVYGAMIKVTEGYKTEFKYSSISISVTPHPGFKLGRRHIESPKVLRLEEKYYSIEDPDTFAQVYFEKFDNTKEWFFKIRIHKKSKNQKWPKWPSLPFQANIKLHGG